MRTARKAGSYAFLVLALALLGCTAFAAVAHAEKLPEKSPGWKILGATGPTNLPPKQSEIQRVSVFAEGGTFTLLKKAAEGEGSVLEAFGVGGLTEGSNIAHITFAINPTFAIGQEIKTFGGGNLPPGTTITGISGPSSAPTIEMSQAATETEGFSFLLGIPKEITGVTTSSGHFEVGDVVSGAKLQPGTKVTAVGTETLNISKFPIEGSIEPEPFALTGSQTTAPLDFDAPASAVQTALEGMPTIGAGNVSVSGGPGGEEGAHPYFVDFRGSLANQDVEELTAESSELEGEHAIVKILTVLPGGPGTGEIVIAATNVGAAPAVGNQKVELGPLPPGVVTAAEAEGTGGWTCPAPAGSSTVVCNSHEEVPPFDPAGGISVPVEVEPTVASSGKVPVTISGGGAKSVTYEIPVVISPQQAKAGPAAFWAGAFNEDGEPELQAGAHPTSAESYFLLNTVRATSGNLVPAGDSKNVIVDLPPGFAGNPLVTERCPQSQLTENEYGLLCGESAIIGNFQPILNALNASSTEWAFPIFNDIPAQGTAAEFTTKIAFPIQSLLASVRGEEDFGIRITAPNNPNYEPIFGSFASLEGVPAASNNKAFLSNPTDCAEEAREAPVVKTASATYQEPDVYTGAEEVLPPVVGCDKLEFKTYDPQTGKGQVAFSFQPTSTTGSTPVGATAHLHIDQSAISTPDKLATPHLKKTVVTLPAGLSLNPSSANGLASCSEAQIGLKGTNFPLPNPIRFTEAQPSCPDASKLGTVNVETPLLEDPLVGEVFLAAQEENPFHSLLAIYLVVNDPRSGVLIKLPGEVQPNPQTGQLTATFDYNPQLSFEDLTLHLRGGGGRSEFATPEVCGTYGTHGEMTPWSAPESGPPAQTSDSFTVSGNCASSPGARPFSPSLEAGTVTPSAGAYSPLVIKIARKDGEQELRSLDFTLPPGLTGKLAGIPYCSDSAISAAEHRSGKEESANPSCSGSSQIGTVDTSAGVGSEPLHVGGKIYLAGPYKGAPLSSVVITPAVAGPFDLGDVVVRAPIYVNPETAQLTAKSDQIPTILRGIPLKVRSVTVDLDRSQFSLNPTNCSAKVLTASIGSSDGATANPSNRFQVGGCDALPFKPNLKLKVIGKTRRNAKPRFRAELTAKPGEANIATAQVNLPHSEFLEQNHIKTVCTRVQFAEGDGNGSACPPGSIYGHATAWSPLLEKPLEGNVYLRSNGGERKLPDLVAALDGQVDIALWGKVDSGPNHGIRNTFEVVPDAPVSRFVLEMNGGRKGLLVNSENLCSKKAKRRAIVRFTGQNGKVRQFKPKVQAQCRKHRKKTKKHKGHKKSGKKK
ncbi:MAG TPA: hypothetical protein VHE08_01475 [Solirubrobacterales bacterium]|nr:hypothetical protein [Solirubrobacterales bacterium]